MKSKEHRLRPGQAAAIMLAAGAALLLLTAKHLMSFRAKTAEQKEQNPVEDASGEIRERAGMIGRLVIPDVGVDAALFESSADAASRQKVVDAMDSALYIPGTDGERDIIADHARQGFAQMEKAVPGKTLLYPNGISQRERDHKGLPLHHLRGGERNQHGIGPSGRGWEIHSCAEGREPHSLHLPRPLEERELHGLGAGAHDPEPDRYGAEVR